VVAGGRKVAILSVRPSSAPLAYVFWHWPSVAVAVPTYEANLLRFHSSLASRPPAGFVRSHTFGVRGAPWLPDHRQSYEDWYLVRDWAALGDLNTGAVARGHTDSHDRVASQAEAGAGGLYGWRAGDDSPGALVATWFAKPPGCSYAQLDSALRGVLDEGFSLWRRQMVLGPAPEFCLRGAVTPRLPESVHGQPVVCRVLR
jgi:hypothetical protein